MANHIIVGCGGIGGWLVPLLLKMKPPTDRLLLMDGDRVEERNFDRQIFQLEYLGWNKAEALAVTYGTVDYRPCYLQKDTRPEIDHDDWIWCCADNHPARLECLNWADELKGQAKLVNVIIGGNEYEYQEAYIYSPIWRNCGNIDPRIRFPEILTEKSGDPARPSCTGLAQKENPQLALFNFLAAGAMVHLWWFQTKWSDETKAEFWPLSHSANQARMQTMPYPTVTELIEQTGRTHE